MIRLAVQRSKCDELVFAGESRKNLDGRRSIQNISPHERLFRMNGLRYLERSVEISYKTLVVRLLVRDGAEADDVIASMVANIVICVIVRNVVLTAKMF